MKISKNYQSSAMDPISASTFNLSVDATSCTSLGQYEKRNFKTLLPQIFAAVIATSTHLAVGIGLAYSAIFIPQVEAENSDIHVSKTEMSWIASVIALVVPLGALVSSYMMDHWGRINTLKISTVPGLLGWTLIAMAQNVAMLITGRMVSGLATALATGPAVVYLTEIARKDMRGSLLALGPCYVSLGLVITYLKGWLMNWRTIAWLCNLYIALPFLLLYLLPESPLWLVSQNRISEARKSLEWLHKYQPQPENNTKSYAELQLQLLIKDNELKKNAELKQHKTSTFREFLKPTGYKPLLIISGLFFFQQFSGIYIFLFYSVSFFEAVGTTVNPYIASILIGIIRLIMSILNTWLLQRFTRRNLIMISAMGMGVSTTISGLFTYWLKNGTTTLTYVPVIFLLLYVVASMIGLLTIPWTMTAEMFPLKIRSLAHSISTSIVNIILFVAVQNYLNFEIFFGGSAGVQWFFASISYGTVLYVFVFLPETHRKTLAEIEDYFRHNTIYLGQKQMKHERYDVTMKQSNESNQDDQLINPV